MASKSLGTLTLDLVARTGGFVQGMDKAERQSAKWRKQVEKDLMTVSKVSGAALGTIVAATTGLVIQQVRAASEITKLAQVSSAGTTEFQRYAAAADVVGINQEKLSDQLKDFNEKAGEFQQSGGGGMKDFFEQIAPQIGITADAFRDLSGPQALQLYYDSLEKAGLSQQQMSFYLESMASDTTALIPLLRNGGAGFKLLGDEAERAGAIMSEETITAADRLSAATLVANNAMAGFRNTIGEQLLPVLGDLAIEFSTVAEEGAVAEDVATALTGTIKGLTAAAVGAFATFQVLGRGMGGLAASTREAMEDMSWWEKLNPMKVMTKTIGSAVRDENESAKAAIDDLDQTLLRYGELINGIFEAGSGGDNAGDSTIDRIAKLREEMRKLSSEVSGGGASSISDEAKKAQEAITKEITALERAAATWGMTTDEVKLYTLAQQGASDAQQLQAANALRVVESLDAQAEAHKRVREEQDRINSEALGIAESLLTEEESILASYERRRQIILDNTKITGEAQTELLHRLEEERNEDLLEVNGSYWEKWLAGAEEALTSFDELAGNVVEQFSGRFGDAFEAMVFDAQTLDEAVANLAEGMLRSIVNAIGQMIAQEVAYQAVLAMRGTVATTAAAAEVAATTTAASASIAATTATTATQTAAAATTAAAWTPAAIAASIGSFGTAAAIGLAAVVAALAFTGGFRKGGYTGAGGVDEVAGVVHGQEYVFDAAATARIGVANLEAIRAGRSVTTASGGAGLSQASASMSGGGGAGLPPVVNIIEDPSKAGQRRNRIDDQGRQALDVWIADFLGEGKTFQAVSRKIGARAVGK